MIPRNFIQKIFLPTKGFPKKKFTVQPGTVISMFAKANINQKTLLRNYSIKSEILTADFM